SNFHVHHLQELLRDCEIKPMVNQVEYHPRLTQQELLTFCKENNIQLEAWSPLMRGQLMDEPTITELAAKYGKTPAQVILRWDLQHGVVTIPKSVRAARIVENADIFNFELSDEDMTHIDALNQNHRVGMDPDKLEF
ncbi:MAG: aldo/keto reductase, partial [Tumebacillaceae bacterium]